MKVYFNLVTLSVILLTGISQAWSQRPGSADNGKIFELDGKKWLWGGEDLSSHFDITNCELKDDQFHYGIGRERFPALIDPEFITVKEADALWSDEARFLVVNIGKETKCYSIKDLTRHEVVNDVIDGKPVMAAYCVLADLGAMYDRVIGDHEFTFALSGYTYYDPEVWDGMDGFVMWDRDTESLWWPLIGRAVSGKLKGTEMKVLDELLWKQTTWSDVKANHPQALVLESGQDLERPAEWPAYNPVTPGASESEAIAPRWGKNNALGKQKKSKKQ